MNNQKLIQFFHSTNLVSLATATEIANAFVPKEISKIGFQTSIFSSKTVLSGLLPMI